MTLTDACKQEVATLLAHISYETGQLQAKAQDGCSNPYDLKTDCDYYTLEGIQSLIWPPYLGKQYYGRGALMLQHNYNYGQFSDIAYYGGLYDKMNLLESPADVTNKGFLSLASAMWVYMTPVPPMPSMHEITTGFYVPNEYDVGEGIKADFGATTNVISNGSECWNAGTVESEAATSRGTAYSGFAG